MWFCLKPRNCSLLIALRIELTRLFLRLRSVPQDHPSHNSWPFNSSAIPATSARHTLDLVMTASAQKCQHASLWPELPCLQLTHFLHSQFTCSLTSWLPDLFPKPQPTSSLLSSSPSTGRCPSSHPRQSLAWALDSIPPDPSALRHVVTSLSSIFSLSPAVFLPHINAVKLPSPLWLPSSSY